jgi:hypothetical protein
VNPLIDAAAGGPDHRRGSTVVTVTDPGGAPLADTEVVVEQVRHAFGFGNIGFDLVPLANGRGSRVTTSSPRASSSSSTSPRCRSTGATSSPNRGGRARPSCVAPPSGSSIAGSP